MEKENRGIIYCVENLDNGKKYVGCTANFGRRIDNHLKGAFAGDNAFSFYSDMVSSLSSFVFKILEVNIPIPDLKTKETFWIEKLNTVNNGYNQCSRSGNEKISIDIVKLIQYELRHEVITFQTIADKFNVDISIVYDINKGRSWSDKSLEYPLRLTSKQKRKLSLEQLREIYDLLINSSLSFNEIAKLYNWRSQSVLRKINNGTYSLNLYPKNKYPLRPVDSRKGSRSNKR